MKSNSNKNLIDAVKEQDMFSHHEFETTKVAPSRAVSANQINGRKIEKKRKSQVHFEDMREDMIAGRGSYM